jgi:hypothetical protein
LGNELAAPLTCAVVRSPDGIRARATALREDPKATLAEVTAWRYVALRGVELGLEYLEVSIPQTHPAGAEAEVDFGEFYWMLNGKENIKVGMFAVRLSHSGFLAT